MNKKLTHIKSLYEAAREAYGETLAALDRNMEQYLGSAEIDGSRESAGLVRNVTFELIESELSAEIPYATVEPLCYSEENERCAEAAERLLKITRDRLPLDELNDADERSTYVFGASLILVEWDKEKASTEHCPIRLRQISPRDFIPEPGVTRIEDMRYCFIRFITTKGELSEKYALTPEQLKLCECGYEYGDELSSEDCVSVIWAFIKGEDGRVGLFVFSGDTTLSDVSDYYANEARQSFIDVSPDGIGGALFPKLSDSKHGDFKINSDKKSDAFFEKSFDNDNNYLHNKGVSMKRYRVREFSPSDFPIVLRKNISHEGELYGRSDADVLRPTQQAINKLESRIMQKLMRSAVTPIMPEGASVTLSNAIFGQVIKIKNGESADSYGTVDTTPDIAQDIEEAERLYDQAKRLIGISDAYQGIDYNKTESGYAKELRINQAEGRLESKRRMKIAAYRRLYRIILEHYICFSPEVRHLSYKDGFGQVRECDFDVRRFLRYDPAADEFYVSDELIIGGEDDAFSEYRREALWERNLKNLESGTLGDKEKTETLLRYWQFQERARYPGAKENAEYFRMKLSAEEKNTSALGEGEKASREAEARSEAAKKDETEAKGRTEE